MKNYQVKYHLSFITDSNKRKEVEEAIEYIRQTEIVPIKY